MQLYLHFNICVCVFVGMNNKQYKMHGMYIKMYQMVLAVVQSRRVLEHENVKLVTCDSEESRRMYVYSCLPPLAPVICHKARSPFQVAVMVGRQLFKVHERATIQSGTGGAVYRQAAENFARIQFSYWRREGSTCRGCGEIQQIECEKEFAVECTNIYPNQLSESCCLSIEYIYNCTVQHNFLLSNYN